MRAGCSDLMTEGLGRHTPDFTSTARLSKSNCEHIFLITLSIQIRVRLSSVASYGFAVKISRFRTPHLNGFEP